MIVAVGMILRNLPAIIGGVKAVAPKRWKKTLNKVQAGAVVAGGGVVATLTLEQAGTALALAVLSRWFDAEIAIPASVVAYYAVSGGATFLATLATGWATPESAEKLSQVEPQ
jgi:hypothetical protein